MHEIFWTSLFQAHPVIVTGIVYQAVNSAIGFQSFIYCLPAIFFPAQLRLYKKAFRSSILHLPFKIQCGMTGLVDNNRDAAFAGELFHYGFSYPTCATTNDD